MGIGDQGESSLGRIEPRAFANVHKYPAQQIMSTPTRRIAGGWVIGPVPDAPAQVIRAGLSDVLFARCR